MPHPDVTLPEDTRQPYGFFKESTRPESDSGKSTPVSRAESSQRRFASASLRAAADGSIGAQSAKYNPDFLATSIASARYTIVRAPSSRIDARAKQCK